MNRTALHAQILYNRRPYGNVLQLPYRHRIAARPITPTINAAAPGACKLPPAPVLLGDDAELDVVLASELLVLLD